MSALADFLSAPGAWAYVAAGVAVTLAIPVALIARVFARPAGKEKVRRDDEHGKWIMSVCGGDKFANSLLYHGFYTQSLGHGLRELRALVTGKRPAVLGSGIYDIPLVKLDGGSTRLFDHVPETGVTILNFGSYSWPPFAEEVDNMAEVYEAFCTGPKAAASMLTIYIEEAHPQDGWWLPYAVHPATFRQPRSTEERLAVARGFVETFKFPIPLVVDAITGAANEEFEAWPERLYVIENRRVIFRSGPGPFGYRLTDLRAFLEERYGARPKAQLALRRVTDISLPPLTCAVPRVKVGTLVSGATIERLESTK